MTKRKTVYVALSLTQVGTEEEKQEIRDFLKWLEDEFYVDILTWAFDTDTWKAKPVDNIYLFDSNRVSIADLVIVLYLSNGGSDGRGAEVVQRVMEKKPIIAFVRTGVKVSLFPVHLLRTFDVRINTFDKFTDMKEVIQNELNTISAVEHN